MNELCQRSIKLTPPGSFTWYTTVWLIILSPLPDFSGNQGNHQNFIPSLARSTLNTLVIFYWNFFIRNSSKKWPTYSGYSLILSTPYVVVRKYGFVLRLFCLIFLVKIKELSKFFFSFFFFFDLQKFRNSLFLEKSGEG